MLHILIALVLAFPILAQAQTPASGDGKYIVTFQPGTSQSERAAAVQRAGGVLRFNYSIVDAVAVRVPNANVLAALRNEPSVVRIVPDRPVHAFQSGNGVAANAKPGAGGGGTSGQVIPEGVKRVGAAAPGSDGLGIGVAIVDTGIDLVNVDLQQNIHPDKFASPSFGTTCQDDNGHGTHVAGIVGAIDNQTGTVGVAPKATLYCVKVLDGSGNGSDSDVIAGLQWVSEHAAIRVVNMSLGRDASADPLEDEPMHNAVRALYNSGVTVVVAAGNEAAKEANNMVPAGFSEALAVASTTAIDGTNSCRRFSGVIKADTASYFTTDGTAVAISAPGEDKETINNGCLISSVGILSTKLGGGTTRMSGTSMASPHVAGVAARMLQQHAWTPDLVRAEVQNTAQSKNTAPLNSPTSSYTFDGVREGIALAPAPATP
jgi:subtilisin